MLPPPSLRGDYVRGLFDRLAPSYDRVNDLMTLGLHRLWKDDVVRLTRLLPGERVLDACTGTGDIAARLAKRVGGEGRVTGLDFSDDMLAIAQARFGHLANVAWIAGDLLELPFADGVFQAVTVGYGLRNVADLDRALAECRRVLVPGGRLVVLDVTRARGVAALHLRWVVPLIGRLFGQREAYHYLPASAEAFVDGETLADRLRQAGFAGVAVRQRWGGGCLLVWGEKGP